MPLLVQGWSGCAPATGPFNPSHRRPGAAPGLFRARNSPKRLENAERRFSGGRAKPRKRLILPDKGRAHPARDKAAGHRASPDRPNGLAIGWPRAPRDPSADLAGIKCSEQRVFRHPAVWRDRSHQNAWPQGWPGSRAGRDQAASRLSRKWGRVSAMPCLSERARFHPSPCRRPESISLRGVPSGLVASKTSSA